MRTIQLTVLGLATLLAMPVIAQEASFEAGHWSFRFDMGGNMPSDPEVTEFSGPINQGGKMDLDAGGQFGMAGGYRLTPWLKLEGEIGVAYNNVERIGDWSYPDSGLSHLLLMANLVVEHPIGRFVPFAGAGCGGDFSYLSFGNSYGYCWDWDPDGEGRDTVFAYQAFAGITYRFSDSFSVGVMYRFFGTQDQEWDVEWWNGADFKVGVEDIRVHAVSLVLSLSF